MSWSEIGNVFSWKLWSAIIGPFFLFSWRNYISWGFQFVNLVIHSFFNIHYLTELRFLSFSLLDSLIKLVTWKLAYQLLENSFMYTQKTETSMYTQISPGIRNIFKSRFRHRTCTSKCVCCDNCDIYKVYAISAESEKFFCAINKFTSNR